MTGAPAAIGGPAESASSPTAAPPALTVGAREIAANRRRAVLLSAVDGLALGLVLGVVLGVLAGAVVGAVVAVVAVVVVTVLVRRVATPLTARLLGARPVDADDVPRLANLVEGLCASFGLRPPALLLVEDPVPNACALGGRPDAAALVVTSGLLDRLGLIEMEGVVAHELAHVKRHDTAVSVVAVAVLAPLAWLTGSDGWLHRAVGRGREYRADQLGTALVRYPPGLHDALAVFESSPGPSADGGSVFAGRRAAMTRWLWIDPSVGRRHAGTQGELDATRVRIDALAEW